MPSSSSRKRRGRKEGETSPSTSSLPLTLLLLAALAAAVAAFAARRGAHPPSGGSSRSSSNTSLTAEEVERSSPPSSSHPSPPRAPLENGLPSVMWYAPVWSGGGYCSEAIAFATSLRRSTRVQVVHHGDTPSHRFAQGLDDSVRANVMAMVRDLQPPEESVVVCHSEPGAWHPAKYPTAPCPNPAHRYLYTVGRTMFETDRLPGGWAERLNGMDEVWVPTEFSRAVFERGGVHKRRLRVVPEPVDTDFFHPRRVRVPYPLPGDPGPRGEGKYKFLSVFKWEERKGWRFLLEAYLREFRRGDPCALYILTNAYHTDADFDRKIERYAREMELDPAELPEVHVLPEGIPTSEMPSVYRAADAFVLPSRGEGWGRPHVEAMSMALPVIATHWSGPTAYLTEEVGYPLAIDGLEPVRSGAFKGHMWARPSVTHLRSLMRRVMERRDESMQRGLRARMHMLKHYCAECVNRILVDEFRRIGAVVSDRAGQP